MTMANKFGLRRRIGEDIKREVRRRCGYGCVICGEAFFDYDHFDPEYVDATEHNPDGIALLCDKHQRAKTAGRLSEASYLAAIEDPFALRQGWRRASGKLESYHRR